MVDHFPKSLDAVFGALSDPTRRSILEQLARGGATVGELAAPFDISVQAVSKHLRKLEAAGLIRRSRSGREVHCRIRTESMRLAGSWLEEQRRFWDVRLDRLETVLNQHESPGS